VHSLLELLLCGIPASVYAAKMKDGREDDEEKIKRFDQDQDRF
jgi:hypothetical protein